MCEHNCANCGNFYRLNQKDYCDLSGKKAEGNGRRSMNDEIVCGDAYQLIKKIPSASVDLIVTDPPYLISSTKGGGKAQQDRFIKKTFEDLKAKSLDDGFDMRILDEFSRVLKKPNIYVWCSKKQIFPLLSYYVPKGIDYDIITWHKTDAMPMCGGKYLNDTEYCLYFHKGVKLNTTFNTAKTYYDLPINHADKVLYGHPTIKPESIISNFIVNSSRGGENVLDPFSGSGTTCFCAKKLGRHYLGFEIDKGYWKASVDRLDGITQQDREKERDGQMRLF
jgi:DNA modification methylase